MSVRESMERIDRAVEDALGARERYEARRSGSSRRESYRKSVEAVRDTAGTTEAEQLARWIEDRIRDEKELPSGRTVRKKGAEIVRDAGHSVSTNDWLGT